MGLAQFSFDLFPNFQVAPSGSQPNNKLLAQLSRVHELDPYISPIHLYEANIAMELSRDRAGGPGRLTWDIVNLAG